MYRIFFSTFSLFLFPTRCFLSFPFFFFVDLLFCHISEMFAPLAPPPAPEMKCLRAVNLSDSRRKGSTRGKSAGHGRTWQWGGGEVAARGVAESSRVFTAMCIVCKSARPSRHLQEWPTMSLRASLLASSGSLAPTWPLTTSKSAKCQVFALVSSPATYIPCAAAPHSPTCLASPPPPTSSLVHCLFLLAFFATKFWRCDIF